MAEFMNRDSFFEKKNGGMLWDIGVSINRTNPLPLDKYSVFPTKNDAEAYIGANESLAYPGQILAVVSDGETKIYFVDYNLDKTTFVLKEITAGGSSSGTGFNLEEDL